jgi:phage terminase Nu1 subunit (DNA packaging protein)
MTETELVVIKNDATADLAHAETDVKTVEHVTLAHVKAVIQELKSEEAKELPVIRAATSWLIGTAFIFLVFGIVLGHYTALVK